MATAIHIENADRNEKDKCEEEPALPKLTEAQGEMISHALCSAILSNSPSQLGAIRRALIDECREVNAKVIGL